MKIELTNEEVVELIESLDHDENFDLLETILNQVLGSDADEDDGRTTEASCLTLNIDTSGAQDAIYAIVDALDDLEEAYNRVSISTGLV